jgi:thioredoxin reductase (NADPH)
MSTRIIDSLPELGGQLMALYPEKPIFDMPGFPNVMAKTLAADMAEQGTRFGADIQLNVQAETLTKDDEGWTITSAEGVKYPTKTLIIAAGAGAFSPTQMRAEREDEFNGKGLGYGVRKLEEFRGKDVLVVGGGDSAFDWILSLHPVAKRVRLVHRRDVFRAHEESVVKAEEMGIEKLLFKKVNEVVGGDSVTGVILEDTQTKETEQVDCDAIVVNIGFKSSLGPLLDWGLEIEKRQIKVDHLFRTGLDGVFAVGDVCTYEGKLKLIATGVGEAASAVCQAKTMLDPGAKLFPGHSSDMDL